MAAMTKMTYLASLGPTYAIVGKEFGGDGGGGPQVSRI